MAIHLQSHAFSANPLRSSIGSSFASFEFLESLLDAAEAAEASPLPPPRCLKVLAFRRGQPLVRSLDPDSSSSPPRWTLGYAPPAKLKGFSADSFVYLGSGREDDEQAKTVFWAVDVSSAEDLGLDSGGDGLCFVDLRTLMVATDWNDAIALGDLAVAGHARALLEWHNASRFCGHCGATTVPTDAGRRKQCTNESCKRRAYPRVDPVVIMLVIDKENDRALLSRQTRFAPRMWSCLSGFVEPGESLEEAVRRETWEETGIEVDKVVYHSSQPWPVGPSSMPCQLMVGFFAYAKTFDINVDKKELDDAEWHSREDVKKALTFAEYEKAQRTSALKLNQMSKGIQKDQRLSDFNVESREFAKMFVPGPFAIAHHLISSWAHGGALSSSDLPTRQLNPASNL